MIIHAATGWGIRSLLDLERIHAETRYFVPFGRKPGSLAIEGHESAVDRQRIIHLPAVEFCLWDALDDATNFQRNFLHR